MGDGMLALVPQLVVLLAASAPSETDAPATVGAADSVPSATTTPALESRLAALEAEQQALRAALGVVRRPTADTPTAPKRTP